MVLLDKFLANKITAMTEHYIHYYDQFHTIQKQKMSDVFRLWVKSKGGNKLFLDYINSIADYPMSILMDEFFRFFAHTFKGEVIFDEDVIQQDYIFDPELYRMYLRRVEHEHNNRAMSPQSILTIVILALAIVGLVKLCS